MNSEDGSSPIRFSPSKPACSALTPAPSVGISALAALSDASSLKQLSVQTDTPQTHLAKTVPTPCRAASSIDPPSEKKRPNQPEGKLPPKVMLEKPTENSTKPRPKSAPTQAIERPGIGFLTSKTLRGDLRWDPMLGREVTYCEMIQHHLGRQSYWETLESVSAPTDGRSFIPDMARGPRLASRSPSDIGNDTTRSSTESALGVGVGVQEIVAWPSERDVLIQITFDEGGAICSSLAGAEMFRLPRSSLPTKATPMTARSFQASIQEKYEQAMDITLFADALALASEDKVDHQQSLCAKCSVYTPELWVTKWVDYSSRYGLGYALSDDSIGVHFNDSTKMIFMRDSNQFDYITRNTGQHPPRRNTHTFEDYPGDLRKKVTLLRHFENYLLNNTAHAAVSKGKSSLPCPTRSPQRKPDSGQLNFIKKWTKQKHAIIFQLSNKIVQAVFYDQTEMLLSIDTERCLVTYFDGKSQVCSYPVAKASVVPIPALARGVLEQLMGTHAHDEHGDD